MFAGTQTLQRWSSNIAAFLPVGTLGKSLLKVKHFWNETIARSFTISEQEQNDRYYYSELFTSDPLQHNELLTMALMIVAFDSRRGRN